MEKLTAIIPTKNEERNIEAVLQSVSFADEIMVVDSYSTDKTLELAKKYTNFILQREYQYSASQKNWAIPQASHEWILLVDSDEQITPELQHEIMDLIKKGTDNVAFWIYRRNHFMGKRIRYSGWQGDRVIRLFKRDHCKYEDKFVHAEIMANGRVGTLKNRMLHFTYTDLKTYLAKMDRYTTWSALDKNKRTKKVTFFHLGIKPCYRFFTHYILRLGILDGKEGFIISVLSAYSVFLRYLKIFRLKENESLS
jgi:glycosyltransferase involved in cell wall biosynthesis